MNGQSTGPVVGLPKLSTPWQFVLFRELTVAINSNHPPMARADDDDEWVELYPAEPLLFHKKWMFNA